MENTSTCEFGFICIWMNDTSFDNFVFRLWFDSVARIIILRSINFSLIVFTAGCLSCVFWTAHHQWTICMLADMPMWAVYCDVNRWRTLKGHSSKSNTGFRHCTNDQCGDISGIESETVKCLKLLYSVVWICTNVYWILLLELLTHVAIDKKAMFFLAIIKIRMLVLFLVCK